MPLLNLVPYIYPLTCRYILHKWYNTLCTIVSERLLEIVNVKNLQDCKNIKKDVPFITWSNTSRVSELHKSGEVFSCFFPSHRQVWMNIISMNFCRQENVWTTDRLIKLVTSMSSHSKFVLILFCKCNQLGAHFTLEQSETGKLIQ